MKSRKLTKIQRLKLNDFFPIEENPNFNTIKDINQFQKYKIIIKIGWKRYNWFVVVQFLF